MINKLDHIAASKETGLHFGRCFTKFSPAQTETFVIANTHEKGADQTNDQPPKHLTKPFTPCTGSYTLHHITLRD